MFIVLFPFLILNMFGLVLQMFQVWCSGIFSVCSDGLCGVYVLLFSMFWIIVWWVFGQAGSPSLSSWPGQEGLFMNMCWCLVHVPVGALNTCLCCVCVHVWVHHVHVHIPVQAAFCFVHSQVCLEGFCLFKHQCSVPAQVKTVGTRGNLVGASAHSLDSSRTSGH